MQAAVIHGVGGARGRMCIIAGFLVLGFLTYGDVLRNGFVALDDDYLILLNPAVHAFNPRSILRAFASYDPELYIPLTLLSYQLTHVLFGVQPGVEHAVNLLLHIGSSLLVTLFLRILTRRSSLALAAGLLFLIHPIQTEAIAWASARKDVLATLFTLGSLIAYVRHARRSLRSFPLMSFSLFLFALLSKVSAVSLPFLLLLIDWHEGRRIDWRYVRRISPFLCLSLLFCAIALLGKSRALGSLPISELPFRGLLSIAFTLQSLLWPVQLSPLYPADGLISILPGILLLMGISALLVSLHLRAKLPREAVIGAGFFLLAYAPHVFNLHKGGTWYLGSDRYVSLASIGAFLLAALVLERLSQKLRSPGVAWIVLGLLAVPLIVLSRAQTRIWRNSISLFEHAAAVAPRSLIAHNNLAQQYWIAGRDDDAIAGYLRALAIDPKDSGVRVNLADAYTTVGRFDDAFREYNQVLERDPQFASAYFGLWKLYVRLGRTREAAAAFRRAEALDPTLIRTRFQAAQ